MSTDSQTENEPQVRCGDWLHGFNAFWSGRRYASNFPRHLAEEIWKAALGMPLYPCVKCGLLRTKEEGGTTFTVCDECWDAKPRNEKAELRLPGSAATTTPKI